MPEPTTAPRPPTPRPEAVRAGPGASRPQRRSYPHVDGVEHRTVRAGAIDMHVGEAGDPEDEPLVMLHGWPQHWYMWRHLIPRLAQRYRVICPDLRGHGWSDAPASGYEKETLAADIAGLLDVLELEHVRLAGHDWGGLTGFLLCLRHPERIERFLALNILHPWPALGAGGLLRALPRLWYQLVLAAPGLGARLLTSRPAFVESLIRGGAARRDTWSAQELGTFSAALREPARAAASAAIYRSFLLRELLPIVRGAYRSQRLETPTLLLFGTEDPAIDAGALEGYEAYAPHMSVELVPGVGHFIAEEAPELVLERALPFFEEGA